jgi:hypothetical protein
MIRVKLCNFARALMEMSVTDGKHVEGTMMTALISLLGVLIVGSVAASFILALIKLDEIDEIS